MATPRGRAALGLRLAGQAHRLAGREAALLDGLGLPANLCEVAARGRMTWKECVPARGPWAGDPACSVPKRLWVRTGRGRGRGFPRAGEACGGAPGLSSRGAPLPAGCLQLSSGHLGSRSSSVSITHVCTHSQAHVQCTHQLAHAQKHAHACGHPQWNEPTPAGSHHASSRGRPRFLGPRESCGGTGAGPRCAPGPHSPPLSPPPSPREQVPAHLVTSPPVRVVLPGPLHPRPHSPQVSVPQRQTRCRRHEAGVQPTALCRCFSPKTTWTRRSVLSPRNPCGSPALTLFSREVTGVSASPRRSSLRCPGCPCTVRPRTKGSGKTPGARAPPPAHPRLEGGRQGREEGRGSRSRTVGPLAGRVLVAAESLRSRQ